MRGYNRIFLIGRLGQDPEIRVGKSGAPWGVLGVATNRARKEGDVWVEETDWHDVKVFGNEAERVQRLGRKGAMVAIEGSLVYETWNDDAGNKRRKARVMASRVQFVSDYRRPDDAVSGPAAAPMPSAEPAEATFETEIPF